MRLTSEELAQVFKGVDTIDIKDIKLSDLNEGIFAEKRVFYVFLDENELGELEFVSGVGVFEGKTYFDTHYEISNASKFVSGHPLIEKLETEYPHLMKYEVTANYTYKLLNQEEIAWLNLSI